MTKSTRDSVPKLRSQTVGRHGENVAARYLQASGMTLVDRNWRGVSGELDLVALDGEMLVICEVKTRTDDRFGGPLVAVTPQKLGRLRRLAGEWLESHPIQIDGLRIDVVGVSLPKRGSARIEHVVGAGQ